MKTILTPEESQRLIDLGVDPKMATYSDVVADESGNHYVEKLIFSLADILSILPKEIGSDDKIFALNIEWCVCGDFADNHQWAVFYCDGFMVSGAHYAPELIDALNTLLIWCLEQKIIKLKEE